MTIEFEAEVPIALVTTQVSVRLPDVPALKVTREVVPPAEIVPPEIDQE